MTATTVRKQSAGYESSVFPDLEEAVRRYAPPGETDRASHDGDVAAFRARG